ncbi:MAG: multidrug effflux MFS transporter [Proteobacteria bacterium]|nr:multidrug effflux MFS transporter [Pseudomonadota bacterium]
MIRPDPSELNPHPGLGFKAFVALVASMMAINALSIDAMLPALPEIGEALRLPEANDRQWVVTAYLLGFGPAQLIYGPLADRFGRKPVLLAGLGAYTVFTVIATFANSLETMILARALQGVGAASTRVLSVSIVRDCYSGRRMARVMSLTFIVFLAAPIAAPTLGQVIVLFAPWPWIFGVLALIGGVILVLAALHMPETLKPEARRPISLAGVLSAFRLALTTRAAVGYMLASTAMIGALFGFITSAQQVFADALDAERWFTAVFALVAVFMALSSLLNSRIVERLGTRRVSHTALLGFIAFAATHAAVALTGHESLLSFILLQSGMMFCFGLVGSNFSAMAMEPLGHIAGTASSIQGLVTTTGGALIGFAVGQQFNGTAVPLTLGFTTCGLAALLIVLVTEKGRLFGAVNPSPQSPVG